MRGGATIARLIAVVLPFAGLAALLPPFGLEGDHVRSLIAYGATTIWLVSRAGCVLGVRSVFLPVATPRALQAMASVSAGVAGMERR